MKYYNKTRTIEQKVTDREILDHLKKQNVLLQSILEELKNKIKYSSLLEEQVL